MLRILSESIRDEAQKLIVRHQTYASHLAEDIARIRRRGGSPPAKSLRIPDYWAVDRGFDPYHVRPRASSIGEGIDRALHSHRYQPRPAVTYTVPKSDGSKRNVCVFQVADNAVSRIVYKNLLAKNVRQFSGRCYAYRDDLSAHDAVTHIAAEFRAHPRLFLAEFDFQKYFDNIDHDYLRKLLGDRRFYVTKAERLVVEAFMTAPTCSIAAYPSGGAPRTRGIPQGTSISLFLANPAGFPLDSRLERIGVGFARFADDTVIWSNSYSKVCEAFDALSETGAEMGVDLNLSKSDGISILANDPAEAEFRSKPAVAFVGYSVTRRTIGMKETTVARAKARISKIIYANLLEGPQNGVIVSQRVLPPIDLDYVTMIYQLRRFLYGGLSEEQLAHFLTRAIPVMRYRGFMSYYPLVNDDRALRALDGWLLHTVWTSLRMRTRLIAGLGINQPPEPHGLSKKRLLRLQGVTFSGYHLNLTLPSFFRIARMFRKATTQYGPNAISHPQSGSYYMP